MPQIHFESNTIKLRNGLVKILLWRICTKAMGYFECANRYTALVSPILPTFYLDAHKCHRSPYNANAPRLCPKLTPTKHRISRLYDFHPKILVQSQKREYFSTMTFRLSPSSSWAASNPRSLSSSSSSSSKPPVSDVEYPLRRPMGANGREGPS